MRLLTMNPDGTRRPRRRRAGFSILEALVAAGVLGIGLIALVKLHNSSMRGMKSSRDTGIAMDIATQAAERLAGMPVADLPNCAAPGGCGPGTGIMCGCRAGLNAAGTPLFTNDKGNGCTAWVADGNVPDLSVAAETAPPAAPFQEAVALTNPTLRYRVDTVITNHPDLGNHQTGRMIEVFVCWRGDDGDIRQVQTMRMSAAGL